MNQHRESSTPRQGGELAGMDLGMRVLSYLIAGVLVYGALGWAADHYLGTGYFLPIGIVLGAAGGCYVIIRRYGQVPSASATTGEHADGSGRRTTTTKTEGAR